jgi:hypothetical protein
MRGASPSRSPEWGQHPAAGEAVSRSTRCYNRGASRWRVRGDSILAVGSASRLMKQLGGVSMSADTIGRSVQANKAGGRFHVR